MVSGFTTVSKEINSSEKVANADCAMVTARAYQYAALAAIIEIHHGWNAYTAEWTA
jgi:hypothetical protein